jgi:hypothetical protein
MAVAIAVYYMPYHPLTEPALRSFANACRHNPLLWVERTYPWGKGPLAGHSGPRQWQRDILQSIGEKLASGIATRSEVIQEAVASGHGPGKSALVAWLIDWAMSTFEDTRGVVTANTETQLRTKTWAELAKWRRMSLASHWFTMTATALYSADPKFEKTWRIDMVAWSEKSTEAFAGLHNEGRRILVLFDEASAIPNVIWEVTEGALTDKNTEIIWFVAGNPTRNTGRFKECFGRLRHRWATTQVDTRTVPGVNTVQIQKWLEDYGEDSDFFRVRVRGMFPRASSLQFIGSDVILAAQKREAQCLINDPLVMALDIARGGDDNCVFRFRRGLDARSIPAVRIPGSEVRDSMRLVSLTLDLLAKHKPSTFFGDGTGVGGPVLDRVRQLGFNVVEVQFGAHAPDGRYTNMRSYMWGRMKEWLMAGGAIDDSALLETDLAGVEYAHDKRDRLILEAKEHMKERGLASPDDGDALAMTFAYPVALSGTHAMATAGGAPMGMALSDWDPIYGDA